MSFFQALLESASNTWINLSNHAAVKAVLSVLAAVLTSYHATALYLFLCLVFIDLFTKLLALSYQCRRDNNEQDDFFHLVTGLHKARRQHYIRSDVMKNRFGHKIGLYMMLTLMGAAIDTFLKMIEINPIVVYCVWMYLAFTEFCSILENLQDAGYDEITEQEAFLKKNIDLVLEIVGIGKKFRD